MFHVLPPIPEEILRGKCTRVETAEEALEIIRKLEQAMSQLSGCLGLAAPQIGILKQVSIIRSGTLNGDLINPVIIKEAMPFTSEGESCMSFPGRYFDVPRFREITVERDALW